RTRMFSDPRCSDSTCTAITPTVPRGRDLELLAREIHSIGASERRPARRKSVQPPLGGRASLCLHQAASRRHAPLPLLHHVRYLVADQFLAARGGWIIAARSEVNVVSMRKRHCTENGRFVTWCTRTAEKFCPNAASILWRSDGGIG